MKQIHIIFILLLLSFQAYNQKSNGFFNYNWIDSTGQLILEVSEDFIGEEFLYVNSLTAGVGSNDIGLDRGQLGDDRVVYFYRSGNKLLLTEKNLKFRAISDNPLEQKAVEEAFASSVIWGFNIKSRKNGKLTIYMNDFLCRDAHGVAKKLKEKKQGQYKLDKTRSVVYKEGLLNFPKNTEMEAMLTFTGNAEGTEIKNVVPDASNVTVRMHHSFIELPDDNYQPRLFHPESGFNFTYFYDYANPIGEDMAQRWINRHRLKKKNKGSAPSEAVEPIVYYIDSGCPEPVKSALMEGGRWWNQAFEAAGYINAFQVKELPEGAHPMDVRYNMIQWVHRSTRGWSYGASVRDPRTGEIIKGHVSLGSLRVRQDYMIAQGLVGDMGREMTKDEMLEMSLARLRQLSAHEIGHTIGLAHNFASSVNDRASVMDYPHPLITLDGRDNPDFSKAYDTKIGEWDKRTIIFGYSDTPKGKTEADYLKELVQKNKKDGYYFITDQDARPAGGAHPMAHLWDNGKSASDELDRLIDLRSKRLATLSHAALKPGVAFSELEKILVPVYLMHRYQVDGTSKLIGGVNYEYGVKGINDSPVVGMVDAGMQTKALESMLRTLDAEFLEIPDQLLEQIPPPAFGYPRDRETFKGMTGMVFDPMAAASASANHTLSFLLNHERLERIGQNSSSFMSLEDYLVKIRDHIVGQKKENLAIGLALEKLFYIHMAKLAKEPKASNDVIGHAYAQLEQVALLVNSSNRGEEFAHGIFLMKLRSNMDNLGKEFKLPSLPKLPPGSPIGCY